MALSVALVAVACGGDDDDDASGDSTPAVTDGTKLGDLTISGEWVRPTTNEVSAAYLVVHNSGAADTLVKATTPLTSTVQLHEVITEGSSSKMQEKPGGFPVPANGMLELKPGGFHIMMMDLKAPIAMGETVALTLTFEKAGDVTIEAPVRAAPDMGGMDHGGMSGGSTTTPEAAATATTPGPVTFGNLTIEDQWVRVTANTVTAAYMVIKNTGEADTLIKATSPISPNVQLHEVVSDGATSKMQPKEGGFPVPANGEVTLRPGAYHIMMLDLKEPVTEGQVISMTLTFEKAGEVTITAPAKPHTGMMEGAGQGMGQGQGMGMATATPKP
jgi:copper(I)-binding protein